MRKAINSGPLSKREMRDLDVWMQAVPLLGQKDAVIASAIYSIIAENPRMAKHQKGAALLRTTRRIFQGTDFEDIVMEKSKTELDRKFDKKYKRIEKQFQDDEYVKKVDDELENFFAVTDEWLKN